MTRLIIGALAVGLTLTGALAPTGAGRARSPVPV